MRMVEPGGLRLPPSRVDGADPIKLAEQYRRFGASTHGMPPLEVTEGADGELMINDGVTRATRTHRYAAAGTLVPVIVIEHRPGVRLTGLPMVCER
jgi:hypothetical protein